MLANWDHQLGLQPIGAGPSPFTNLSTQIKEDSDFHLAPLRKVMGGNIVGILIGSWIVAGTIPLGVALIPLIAKEKENIKKIRK
ncbi:MAG: hypothetical protein B5M54_06855 [Candidatus Aminicenantes bacterium 4484_214]|nr:MAG: hypothetical protein B5M54_06855 [Candidatus Aminicenantes bacterium 4484_214]